MLYSPTEHFNKLCPIPKDREERSSSWTSFRAVALRSQHPSERGRVARSRVPSSTFRRRDQGSLGQREQWNELSLREPRAPLGGRATHRDTGQREEWNERNLHEPMAPLRGRATHFKTGRLRQKWIRRRRLSKIPLAESRTPLRGRASRRITH